MCGGAGGGGSPQQTPPQIQPRNPELLSHLSESTNNKNLFSSEKDEKINSLIRSIDNTNYRKGQET